MIVHDLGSCIKTVEKVGASNWQTGAHLQVLIEVLKNKGLFEDSEMREMWNRLIPEAVEEMKKKS
jgi:hypothetical protein